MPKRAVGEAPEIALDHSAGEPIYRQLYERLRARILSGQLAAGARLPSTRGLAATLGVSRTTTALAYELLLLEGYIVGQVGAGTRVAQLDRGNPPRQVKAGAAPHDPPLAQRVQPLLASPLREESLPPVFHGPFGIGQPDVAAFPWAIWARLVAKHARHSLPQAALYQDAQGYAPLRAAIAAHIGVTRGVHCAPEQIILTAGAQGALDLIARVLLNPNDAVWVEDPGHQGARGPLLAAGARLIPVPVDGAGINVAAGRALCPDARLAVVTPSHQFPTGVTLSLNRRLDLLAWSQQANAWLVEDDYDSEFRYSGRPLEALQGLDGAGRVIYVGTFSKMLFPALRMGYLVVPPALLPGMLAARRFIDNHLPPLEQFALADFLAEGHLTRHLRTMRQRYTERRRTLIAALTELAGDILTVTAPEAGIHLCAWLPEGVSAAGIVERAAARGLMLSALGPYYLRPAQRDGLLFGFASGTDGEIRAAVATLAEALRG